MRSSRPISAAIALVLLLPCAPATAQSTPMIGQITTVAFNFCPRGWAETDGQLLPISQYSALFSLLGTTYGGDGRMTFALPDLRGRVVVHNGQGPGLSDRSLGAKGGSEQTVLSEDQMPAHSHDLNVTNSRGTIHRPANGLPARGTRDEKLYARTAPTRTMAAEAIGTTGGNAPIETMPPFLTLKTCIALEGVYPSRS
ncbi:MAG: tail fiber protein [Pseudomonadota bacterium]